MSKRVLVIGGNGFIGSATCRFLERHGAVPVVADAVTDGDTWEKHALDIGDVNEVFTLFEKVGPSAVVNLAFRLADACENDLDGAFRVNVLGSQNVIEACRQSGVERYVYASSIAVYGDQSSWGEHALTEEDQGRPVRLYGWHKLLQETIAANYARQGLACVGLRISTVYGVGRRAGLSSAINTLVCPPPNPGRLHCPWSMDEEFDLIHVDDVADALTGLVFAPHLDFLIYNSGGEFATLSSIAQTLEKIRPDVTVECSSPPATLAHCSRIDWRRLRDFLGDDRLSLNTRMSAMANNE